jgi:hypothetical protein
MIQETENTGSFKKGTKNKHQLVSDQKSNNKLHQIKPISIPFLTSLSCKK